MQHLKVCQNEKEINLIVKQYHCSILLWIYVLEKEDFTRASHNKIYLQQLPIIFENLLFVCLFFLNMPQRFHLCTDFDIVRLQNAKKKDRIGKDKTFYFFFLREKKCARLVGVRCCYQKLSHLKAAY